MKVILVHDWLTGMRGGEKVLEMICRIYPKAPLHTLLHIPGSVSAEIENRPIKTSLLQHLPFSFKKYRHYLPLFPLLTELNKVKDADLVISDSSAVAKAMIGKRRGNRSRVHICYIHSPMRYIWDRFDDYFGPERVGWLFSRFFFRPIAYFLRLYDLATLNRVDVFVANSSFVAERVRRFYGREALVLPPPVQLSRFSQTRRNAQDWYLVVTALVPYKRVDQAIEACASLGRKLRIVGGGPEERNLRELAGSLGGIAEFYGSIDNETLVQFYGEARALLFPGVEDFGIVPLEAIASGCPVIALKEGGVLDSMTDETALFYERQTAAALARAIVQFENEPERFKDGNLRARARDFSEENFLVRFRKIIEDTLKTYA